MCVYEWKLQYMAMHDWDPHTGSIVRRIYRRWGHPTGQPINYRDGQFDLNLIGIQPAKHVIYSKQYLHDA